jgi:hypothetical protein
VDKLGFHIVALPRQDILNKLNDLRDYFYLNNFRFTNKPNKSDAHITLVQGTCEKSQIEELKVHFEHTLDNWKPFQVSYTKVTSDRRGPVADKCEYDNCWVALLFDDEDLKRLGREADSVLREQNVSTTAEYTSKILSGLYIGRELQRDVIANHINLCNHCRPEKASEVVELIEKVVPKDIAIDRIAFRRTDATLSWVIDL